MPKKKNSYRQRELAKRRSRVETGKRLAKLPFTLADDSTKRDFRRR